MASPKVVAITGGAGQIGYSILPRIAAGEVFGKETPVILKLLEIPVALESLEGVGMELEDCAFPLLEGIVCTDEPEVAFQDCDLVFLIGSKPRGPGMERKDLIQENGPIFTGQGAAIDKVAKKSVRTIVVGNPCNTNCLIAMHHAPSIPDENFSAMTQLDHNRAIAQLAVRAGVHFNEVKNPIIWGNHSNTQFPDWKHAMIQKKPAEEVIADEAWFKDVFIPTVQERGKAIIQARGKSSALSAANAAIDHAHTLFNGTPEGTWTSMAVKSDGSYGVPEGLICSFPVTCKGDGTWEIVQGLEFTTFGREKFDLSIHELEEERETVKGLL